MGGSWNLGDAGGRGSVEEAVRRTGSFDSLDGDGEAPLHMAARGGYPNVVRALLSAGARPDVKSDAGLYPWNYADEGSELEAMLPKVE